MPTATATATASRRGCRPDDVSSHTDHAEHRR